MIYIIGILLNLANLAPTTTLTCWPYYWDLHGLGESVPLPADELVKFKYMVTLEDQTISSVTFLIEGKEVDRRIGNITTGHDQDKWWWKGEITKFLIEDKEVDRKDKWLWKGDITKAYIIPLKLAGTLTKTPNSNWLYVEETSSEKPLGLNRSYSDCNPNQIF